MDYVQFENPEMLNDFISAWRATGHQRFGYLYGRYDVYDQVRCVTRRLVHSAKCRPRKLVADVCRELLVTSVRGTSFE